MFNNKALELLLSNSPLIVHDFLIQSIEKLNEHKVQIIIQNTPQVQFQDIACSGFFHHQPLQFAVAIDKDFKEWFRIFIHEYCHFQQYLDMPKEFNQISDHLELFFDWLSSKVVLSDEQIKQYKEEAIQIEFDCETRVLEFIKKYQFESILSLKDYAQKANAYVNFYHYVVEEKKWYKAKQEPYSLKEVYQLFPTQLIKLTHLNEKMKKAYQNCVDSRY